MNWKRPSSQIMHPLKYLVIISLIVSCLTKLKGESCAFFI